MSSKKLRGPKAKDSRKRALAAAGVKDLFPNADVAELRHLARRATAVPNARRVAARNACRRAVGSDD